MNLVICCPLAGSARWARLLWKFPALKALSGLAVFLCTYVVGLCSVKIAGLHVTSWRPCWWTRTKAFSPLGTKPYFHVNSSRKNSIGLTFNMAALSRGCKNQERPFRSCPKPLFQSEAKCEAIDMKAIFYYHASKTHFHKKVFVLSLVLKGRVFGTRK